MKRVVMFVAVGGVWLLVPSRATGQAQIVFAAGPKDHGEFYIRLRMPDTDPRRTPLLFATTTAPTRLPAITQPMVPGGPPSPLTDPNVEPSLVSWAIQGEGGGRGFVMTGVDWAANLEVPAGGVQCSLPSGMN